MVDKILGKWKLEKNDNMVEYMKANNISFALRQIGSRITSYEHITLKDDTWTLDITSTFKSGKLVFKLGEEIDELTLDGRSMKSTFTVEGEKLIQKQEPTTDKDLPSVFSREILEDGRMLLTCTSVPKNVVAKRYFVPD